MVAGAFLCACPLTAHAGGGGAIGWAAAVNQFSTEAVAVGVAAGILGIVAVGAMMMFNMGALLTTIIMVCLGGALMANAQTLGGTLFGAGGGGGSIYDTGYAAPHAAPVPG